MSATAAERIAYTVECFFNAARIEDSAERTGLEQKVCQCLLDHDKGKPFAVLHRQALFLYRDALFRLSVMPRRRLTVPVSGQTVKKSLALILFSIRARSP